MTKTYCQQKWLVIADIASYGRYC